MAEVEDILPHNLLAVDHTLFPKLHELFLLYQAVLVRVIILEQILQGLIAIWNFISISADSYELLDCISIKHEFALCIEWVCKFGES